MSTILILGNGFDLAHGLPTRYSDFLEYSMCLKNLFYFQASIDNYRRDNLDKWVNKEREDSPLYNAIELLKKQLIELYSKKKENIARNKAAVFGTFNDLYVNRINKNIWFNYLYRIYQENMVKGNNWVDFESEIALIISYIDNVTVNIEDSFHKVLKTTNKGYKTQDEQKIDKFIANCSNLIEDLNGTGTHYSINQLRDRLYDDLQNLTEAFEIYLTIVVSKLSLNNVIDSIKEIKPDYVLNFNYTLTYEKLYNIGEVCHIHGKCRKVENDFFVGENEMVLGIDEYLAPENRSSKTRFAIFKKYVQRIRKRNDVSYIEWEKIIEENIVEKKKEDKMDEILEKLREKRSEVYVYGHSLDKTDKDVLERFLKSDATNIHIYARNKNAEGNLISNLITIIEYDKVIEKSTSNPPRIVFFDNLAVK